MLSVPLRLLGLLDLNANGQCNVGNRTEAADGLLNRESVEAHTGGINDHRYDSTLVKDRWPRRCLSSQYVRITE